MTKAKHTPAPWKVFDRPGTLSVFAGDKIGRNEVVHWTGFDASHFPKATKANARLIAAAPDMLALLQELIDIEGPQPGTAAWAKKVHAVITKATGSQS